MVPRLDFKGAKECESDRSRQELSNDPYSNECLVAKCGVGQAYLSCARMPGFLFFFGKGTERPCLLASIQTRTIRLQFEDHRFADHSLDHMPSDSLSPLITCRDVVRLILRIFACYVVSTEATV